MQFLLRCNHYTVYSRNTCKWYSCRNSTFVSLLKPARYTCRLTVDCIVQSSPLLVKLFKISQLQRFCGCSWYGAALGLVNYLLHSHRRAVCNAWTSSPCWENKAVLFYLYQLLCVKEKCACAEPVKNGRSLYYNFSNEHQDCCLEIEQYIGPVCRVDDNV